MTIAWLTDLHLDYVKSLSKIEDLCKTISLSGAHAVLITGDIATEHLHRYLDFLTEQLQMPIYFVLGNHDYYGSSIGKTDFEIQGKTMVNQQLIWLSRTDVIELSPSTCLVGHEGLADGRLGDPVGSQVEVDDYYQISELIQPSKELRLAAQHKLGDEAATWLRTQLTEAVKRYLHIIVALHVPPFAEACWHDGKNTDDEHLPHYGCKATGEVLKAVMLEHPEISMTVYCGHGHSEGYVEILPNLKVITGGAKYGFPRIAAIIELV
jgi:3',5'-cyclic AMP phosphodiesterase CpdA